MNFSKAQPKIPELFLDEDQCYCSAEKTGLLQRVSKLQWEELSCNTAPTLPQTPVNKQR